MVKNAFVILIIVFLTGCAGIEITSLSIEKANNAHKPNNEVKGYIVYHPMLVVEVSEKELCIAKNSTGKCIQVKTVCGIGEPKTLPDYTKPYLLNPKSGFGNAGIEVKIEDGWRVGGIKNQSDNTALLGVLVATGGIKAFGLIPGKKTARGCSKKGLYKLSIKNKKMILMPLLKF